MYKRIPLIGYPFFHIDEGGHILKIKSPERCREIMPSIVERKTPRVALIGLNNFAYFKVWVLVQMAHKGEQGLMWDERGYRFFKQIWQPVYRDSNMMNFHLNNVELRERDDISPFIFLDDVEYKWWFDKISGMDCKESDVFNSKLINSIKLNTYKLTSDAEIKKFLGGIFSRGGEEVKRVVSLTDTDLEQN